MATFGYTGVGLEEQTFKDRITGSVFTCSRTGIAKTIAAYVWLGEGQSKTRAALYEHSDLSLIGETEEKTRDGPDLIGWQVYTFTGEVDLVAGTDYILVLWGEAEGILRLYYADGDATQGHYQELNYGDEDGDYPDPFVPTHEGNKYSIYCTYIYLEQINLLKQRLLISDETYDDELFDALDEAARYAIMQILAYDADFSLGDIMDNLALLDAVLDIAAGIFKRRHMPQDMDAGWWAQGIKKLESYIKSTYKVGAVFFVGMDE